jgi:DNA gyrase subunit B
VRTTDLRPVADDGTTGTTVHFHPDLPILVSPGLMAPELTRDTSWPQLRVELVDERPS